MLLPPGRHHFDRRGVWTVTSFLLLCHYMLMSVKNDAVLALHYSFFLLVVPVLVAAVLYYRRPQDGTEYKLLLAYWLWFWFSRALNGSPLLDHDFRRFFDFSLTIPFLAFGSSLTKEERNRFLDWLSAVFGSFYFVFGLIALHAFLHRSMYELPALSEIGIIQEASYARINFFGTHPNTSGYWYLISLFLMIYQFFHCKQKLWRIPILLSATLDLVVIAITYSRSVRLCMAMAFALLTAVLLLRALQNRPRFLRTSIAFLAAILVLIASYESSGLCADVMATLSYDITDMHPISETTAQNAGPQAPARAEDRSSARPVTLSSGLRETPRAGNLRDGLVQSDPRPKSGDLNNLSSNRIAIWRAAFQAITVKPSVLWRGQLYGDAMTITHHILGPDFPGGLPWHFHNELLQILMITGLPGLILASAFLFLVFCKAFRSLFCSRFPLDDRMLALPVLAVLPRIMLEASLFTSTDILTLFFILMCGMTIGLTRE